MKYKTDKSVKGKVKFIFEVTQAEWESEIEAAYQKTKGKYKVQGFRPGHAPRKIVEKNYGAMVFFDDAFNDMFIKHYGEAVRKETDFEPVGQPEIDITDMTKGITFTAEVEIKPEIVPQNYKGHTLKKISRKVTEKEINAEIEKAREKASREITVTDRAAQDGDITVIDYSGSVAGKKFEGGTAKAQTLKLGSNTFIPGFESQVAGMKIGEHKDITVTFPEEYQEKTLAGKEAVFAVTLHEIKQVELPKVDDDFAKDVSEFATLKEYKEDVKKRLQEGFDEQAAAEMENVLVDKIVALHEFDIPQAMIESQLDRKMQEVEYRLMYQGMRLDDYLKMMGMTRDDLRKDYIAPATKSVKTRLVLEGIVKAEKLDVTDKDVAEEIKKLAKAAKKTEKEYKEVMSESEVNYIKNDIITKKLTDFLKANNTFDENAPEEKNAEKPAPKKLAKPKAEADAKPVKLKTPEKAEALKPKTKKGDKE